MFEPLDLLRTYLQGIRYFTGAVSASLYVPAKQGGESNARLIHSGEHRSVPELETLADAQEWTNRAQSWIEEAIHARPDSMPVPFSSVMAEGTLLALPDLDALATAAVWATEEETANAAPFDLEEAEEPTASKMHSGAWLGLRFAPGSETAAENLVGKGQRWRIAHNGTEEERWRWLFTLGGAMASHSARVSGALSDPQTGLLSRAGMRALLGERLSEHRPGQPACSLLFLNPDGFAAINDDLGRAAAEQCVREIAVRLSRLLRRGQIACRFGGVVFAVLLTEADEDDGQTVGERLRKALGEDRYLGGSLPLDFSCGVSSWDPERQSTPSLFEMIRRADQSLHRAKEEGGDTLAVWSHDESEVEPPHFDRLAGIFTGNHSQDYRNMAILWEAMEAVSTRQPFDQLSVQMVSHIYRTFRAREVALFQSKGGTLDLVAHRREGGCPERNLLDIERYRQLLLGAGSGGRSTTLGPADNNGRFAAAVGLNGQDGALGCLFIETQQISPFETEDLMFLRALGNQLGVALERMLASDRKKTEEALARARLESELEDLRLSVGRTQLIYRSPQMQELLETASRVAPIDATVLITGSSGTGKEVLASTIHDLSGRRDKKMVVVDCGAISTSLIESELFGHEKGAYTGAQSRRQGRLLEANGSTLFLDEIGELPLEVQSKLLRFVQERELTAVGGGRTEEADVRIVAATNRNLEFEVAEGRFRADLFYRLNVVRLHIADLRDRPEDIPHLAEHFLHEFVRQYKREIYGFDQMALSALSRHHWKGNVRELKNRILRACILTESQYITAQDLGLVGADDSGSFERIRSSVLLASKTATSSSRSADRGRQSTAQAATVLSRLESELSRQISALRSESGDRLPALGRWMFEDLLLEAQAAASGVNRQAAQLIGLPETTFRRQIKTVEPQNRSDQWPQVRALIAEAVRCRAGGPGGLASDLEDLLLSQIIEQLPRSTSRGAALLGVSPPTFRNKLAKLGGSRPEPISHHRFDAQRF